MRGTSNSKSVGELSTARILSRLLDCGYWVSLPFGDNLRYDLIADDRQRLWRVQCKTGKLDKGSIAFPVSSSANHRGLGRRHYLGEVDAFGVFCPQTEEIYFVPVAAIADCRREVRLRVLPARNGQSSRIRPATEFALQPIRHAARISSILAFYSPIAQSVERRTVNLMAARMGNRTVKTPLIRGTLKRVKRQGNPEQAGRDPGSRPGMCRDFTGCA